MGTSLLCVKFKDGTIMYSGYQNTTDVAHSLLFKSCEDFIKAYESSDGEYWAYYDTCRCTDTEEVELATMYGDGFSWKGVACKKCKLIVGGHSAAPYDINFGLETYEPKDYKDGLPEWFPK